MPDDLLKATIAQAVRLKRLENTAGARATRIFDSWFDAIFGADDFQAVFNSQLPTLYDTLRTTSRTDAISIAASESRKAADALGRGIAKPVTVERLTQIYRTDAIEGFTVDDWWRHNERKLRERWRVELRAGIDAGEDLGQLKARLENNVLSRSRRHVDALVRTSTNNLTNAAIWETGEANPQLTRGYRLIVTFDRRTSQICLAFGERNLIYPYAPSSPRPPFHFLCRTIIQPVLRGKEHEKPIDAGEWLKRQGRATQDEILGPRRAELFRKGRIDLSDLIRSDLSITSIPELLGVGVSFNQPG